MEAWQMICAWLQDVVELHPQQFVAANAIVKQIKLAHYEEIYG